MVFVFFFKQKTAYEMRISDWSSDVCSSDLARGERGIVLAIAQDRRADEYHQIGLGAAAAARFEQLADQRNIAEQRDALDRPAFVVVEQSADREHLPIVGGQHRLERALVEDQVAVARRDGSGDAGHFLPDEHLEDRKSTRLNSSH